MNEASEVPGPVDFSAKQWGLWPTVGWCLVIIILWIVVQVITAIILAGVSEAKDFDSLNGWSAAICTIISAPITIGAVVLLVRLRNGISVAEHLGLKWPSSKQIILWSLVLFGYIIASDLLSFLLDRPSVPESMEHMYRTAGYLPVFYFGIVGAAPLVEEFIFRGFLMSGLLPSRLRAFGAITITALVWGFLHVQYDLYDVATIVATGILLGVVRWRTGSLWLCVVLHAIINIVSSVEIMMFLS